MPPGPQRQVFRFPSFSAGFRGLLQREGLTDESYQGGYLAGCTNFHLIGRGRLKKRSGHRRHVTALPGGANYIQGLAMYEFGQTRHLVSVVNGTIVRLNDTTWTAITGALTPPVGQNYISRFTQFSQGEAGAFLVGTGPNNTALWKWSGSGDATVLVPAGTTGPAYAGDIEEFYGRLWAVATDAGNTITEFSDDGRADVWPTGNDFHATRSSLAVGLCKHNDGALLVFHQRSVHRVEPLYDSASRTPFGVYLVDGSVGAEGPHSIVNSKGVTYFASRTGFHRIRDPRYPAEYIGWPIEDYWNTLNQARSPYIFGFERGEPWNEIVWLVSTGSNTAHNAVVVYNTELDAWSVFTGLLAFNCGCNYTDADGKQITILGGNTGIVSEAWGDDNYETGYVDAAYDEQTPITTTFKTGFLEWGYAGLKRLREMWLDMQLSDTKTFYFQVKGIADSPAVSQSKDIGAAGAAFGSFIFGVSAFAGSDPTQAKVIQSAKSRLFQLTLTESDDGPAWTLNAIRFWWRPSGARLKAVA